MNTFYIEPFDFCYKRLRAVDAKNSQGLVHGEADILLCLHSLFKITKKNRYLDEMYETLNFMSLFTWGTAERAWTKCLLI